MRTTIQIVVLAAILFATPAAATIEMRDYLAAGDGLLVYDSETDLEWLNLTVTLGQTVATALGDHTSFELATTDQVEKLFTDFGVVTLGALAVTENRAAVEDLLEKMGCTSGCDGLNALGKGHAIWSVNNTVVTNPFYRVSEAPAGSAAAVTLSGFTETQPAGNYLVRQAEANGAAVPEPSSAMLYLVGLLTVGGALRRTA